MRLVPAHIESLEPYKPGKPIDELRRELGIRHVVKLASNENPLGPSPRALEGLRRCLQGLHLYPNGGFDLRCRLAEVFGLRPGNVITGSGSEGILCTVIRTFLCDDDEVLTSEGTFVGFYVLARSRGIPLVTVPLKDYAYDLTALAEAVTPRTKLVYLANPNNPTGTRFTRTEFEAFLDAVPRQTLILMDEAYFEYARRDPDYPDALRCGRENVLTLRTFSKIYGLAGLRIGYGFGSEELIGHLLRVKLPFEPSTPAQAAGIAALEDGEFLERSLEVNEEGIRFLVPALRALGYAPVPTHANFLMIPLRSQAETARIYDGLLHRGVIVRPLGAFGLPHCIRITVGTPDENRALVEALGSLGRGMEQPEPGIPGTT
ncbi:MAG: histidinol-phosphate transaminase [Bacteroidota bacterium]